MVREIERGEIVLAPDPFSGKSRRRPFIIVSDEDYPFHPHGYLGVPVTSNDRPHTLEIHEYDMEYVNDSLNIQPSYANPWSPSQVNDAGRTLLKLSDNFVDILAEQVSHAVGLSE